MAEVHNLSDDNIVLLNVRVKDRNAILTDCCVTCVLELASVVLLRTHELLLASRGHVTMLLVLVHRVVESAKQTSVD